MTSHTNQLQMALQKHLFEILKEKYAPHQNIVERIGHYLVTERDLKEFANLVADIYEVAYTRAFKDYQKQIEASTGLRLAVSTGKKD